MNKKIVKEYKKIEIAGFGGGGGGSSSSSSSSSWWNSRDCIIRGCGPGSAKSKGCSSNRCSSSRW